MTKILSDSVFIRVQKHGEAYIMTQMPPDHVSNLKSKPPQCIRVQKH